VTASELAIALALGLIFGSFANVCIHRIPLRRSIVWPGSSCPSCGSPIVWYDNIPVLSWLMLRGRCRVCGAPIAWSYPLVEALSALLLVQLCVRHGLTLRWAALSYLALSILVLVPIDWRHGILPDRITLPGIAAGFAFSLVTGEPGWIDSLLGVSVGGLVPLTIRALYISYVGARTRLRPSAPAPSAPALDDAAARREPDEAPDPDLQAERREGMGLGDVKMLMMVGAFLGVWQVLLTMLLGSVLGTLYVLPLVMIGRRSMKSSLPFGPFLGLAAILGMFWGPQIIDWYTQLVVRLPI